jgi:hypothetical protein
MAKKVLCSSHVPWIPDRPSSGSLAMLNRDRLRLVKGQLLGLDGFAPT